MSRFIWFTVYNHQLKSLDFVINNFFMKLFKTSNMQFQIVSNSSILPYPVFNSPAVLRSSWTSCTFINHI